MKISTTESTGIGSLSKQIGKEKNNNLIRPSLFDDDVVWDNAQNYKLPEGDIQTSIHPAECAIFVVHGMGEQEWVETAAHLRKNLEDIIAYECSSGKFAAPFIYDGYWANYHNLEVTFPANWQKLNRDGERPFFQTTVGYSPILLQSNSRLVSLPTLAFTMSTQTFSKKSKNDRLDALCMLNTNNILLFFDWPPYPFSLPRTLFV